MAQENTARPVIVLLDARPTADNKFIKRWFEKSRYVTCESRDVCDALVEFADFTTPHRPDVILLEVESPTNDMELIRRLTATGSIDAAVVAISADGDVRGSVSLAQLQIRLDKFIPAPRKLADSVAA